MPSPSDLVKLASNLREEHIFVKAETQQLSRLNTQLSTSIENLYHEAWTARTQRRALELLLAQRSDLPADSCLLRLNAAAATKPVDGYRVLGYKESAYGECLKVVRENPELLAECLVRGERSNPEKMQEALRTVLGSLYGYGLIPEDQEYSLKLLKSLIEIQLDASSNPRRLLKNVSTFSYAYKIFVENLHETKLYLAAALHQPILQVLAEDDCFLDIDPGKLSHRFLPEERLRRFGEEGTEQYNINFKRYRTAIVKRLVNLAQKFIRGLIDNLFCFPPSLCWIISQVYERIQSQHTTQSTLPAVVCTDLIFAHFICPAIIQPEPYALTSDIPVSYSARFNLMQIAQVLHTLAVSKWETIDPKLMDVYGSFEPNCMWKLLDMIMEMRTSDILVSPSLPSDSLNRSAALMSVSELNFLVGFLKDTSADKPGSRVPSDIFRNLVNTLAPIEVPKRKEEELEVPAATSGGSGMKSKLKPLKSQPSRSSENTSHFHVDEGELESSGGSTGGAAGGQENQVLVISLGARETGDLGLLSEQKVLALSKKSSAKRRTRFSEDQDSFEVGSVDDEAMSAFSVCSSIPDSVSVAGGGGPGKPIGAVNRFDESSLIPSDGLGAVSEEMSGQHSVASSVDGVIEGENDNLSDDVSASISGRASPSVSGRDTPSPVLGAAVDIDLLPSVKPNNLINLTHPIQPRDLPVSVQKMNREDVPEKFGQFYIPVDETRSTISDAWSTEVAASDIEGFNYPPVPVAPIIELNVIDDPVFAVAAAGGFDSDDDRWSVDVAASVSNASQEPLEDRMAELELEPNHADLEGPPIDVGHQEALRARNFEVTPPLLPNPSGKYVSFANDDKFHHYPPEHDLLMDNFGGVGDRSHDFEDEDPTINLPLNVFAAIPPLIENSMGGSAPSSCSSFSNLSGFSNSFESDRENGGLLKRNGIGMEQSNSSTLLGSLDLFGTPCDIIANKPPPTGRKGSLSKDPVILPNKDPPSRQLSFKGSLLAPENPPDAGTSPGSSRPLGLSGSKKNSFLKSFATSLRGKHKRSPGKPELVSPLVQSEAEIPPKFPTSESTDDILARYRKKPLSSPAVPVPSSLPPLSLPENIGNVENCVVDFAGISEEVMLETAKRKVRIVLNSFDIASVPCLKMRLVNNYTKGNDPALLPFLKIQLSEAIGLQDRSLIAQLHEAIRCVKALDARGTKRLVEALRNDYRSRDVYTAYLIRCRKTLLNSLQHIENLLKRTKRDSSVCVKYFISVCVNQLLEKRDREVKAFVREFQKLSLSDEKTALVESFLHTLYCYMANDSLWRSCTEQQRTDGRETLERQIMSQVYLSALYPNDDVDRMRDQVLHEHMRKLAKTLTPDHKDLKISKVFHLECPWPSAQAEIASINAYKTPKDKVQCVVRCSGTLMNLLSLAADSSIPAADDFMPALVYVLIRANPPSLLSTVQYVNSFYGSRLVGEESYWWTQFASAIEYIKNMDYSEEPLIAM